MARQQRQWSVDIELVRERAFEHGDPMESLDFYGEAVKLGAGRAEAEAIDEHLTVRVMTARGAI